MKSTEISATLEATDTASLKERRRETAKLAPKSVFAVVDQGVIFRNPLPGHIVVNSYMPFALAISQSHWVCLLRTGCALYSHDGVMELLRSTDDGKSWTREGPIFPKGTGYSHRDGALTLLRDGTLVARISRVEHPSPDRLIFNATTGGMLPRELCIVESQDHGRTWSEPVIARLNHAFPVGLAPAASGAIVELADGTWMQAFETWKSYENAGAFDLNSYALYSRDRGRTWTDCSVMAHGGNEGRSYSHGRPIRLRDGRVLSFFWAADAGFRQFLDLHAVWSTDAAARAWTLPRPLMVRGQTHYLVELTNGLLALVYCQREQTDQPGIKAILSADEGDTWDTQNPALIWDAYGREAIGVARTDKYPSSHDTIAYGAPQATRLNERELLVTFWCTLGPDTHCRWCRLRVD